MLKTERLSVLKLREFVLNKVIYSVKSALMTARSHYCILPLDDRL